MRVAWFTPLWTNSAVGTFSRHVASRLARVVDVELWVPEIDGDPPVQLPLVEFDPNHLDQERLLAADVLVYNLGNNFALHGAICQVAAMYPGLLVLHDSVMHHFFASRAHSNDSAREEYGALLRELYGGAVSEAGLRHLGQSNAVMPPIDFCARYPMLEVAASMGRQAIVHSLGQQQTLGPVLGGAVHRLYLPCYGAETLFLPRVPASRSPLVLMTVGWVDPTKQIHRVIEAVASSELLRSRVRYDVIGDLSSDAAYLARLRVLIEAHGLHEHVRLMGSLSPAEFAAQLDRADVFVNLRRPTTEGGSASLLEQLARGRATVVSPAGVFDEFPDDAVVKVDVDTPGELVAVLEQLVVDDIGRQRVGMRGQEVVSQMTVEGYVRGLLDVLLSMTGPDASGLLSPTAEGV